MGGGETVMCRIRYVVTRGVNGEMRGEHFFLSSVHGLVLEVLRNLHFPHVAVLEQLLLIVEEFLSCFSAEFSVRTLDDSIDGTSLLTEAAVNALGHVDVVPGRSASSVLTLLGFDSDGLRRANGLTELACDAPLLTRRVTTQHVLTTEPRGNGALLERVVNRDILIEKVLHAECHPSQAVCRRWKGRKGVVNPRENGFSS